MENQLLEQLLKRKMVRYLKYVNTFIRDHQKEKKSSIYEQLHQDKKYQKRYEEVISCIMNIEQREDRMSSYHLLQEYHERKIKSNILYFRRECHKVKV